MDKDDISLPKATVSKLIKEMLPENIKCSNDARDLILDCCVEFIHLISSEANDCCGQENKKTIAPEHILKALESLGFNEYIEDVTAVYDKHKEEIIEKPKGTKKLENLGIPTDELLNSQKELFEKARSALRSSQQNMALSAEQRQQLQTTAATSTAPPPIAAAAGGGGSSAETTAAASGTAPPTSSASDAKLKEENAL